MSIPGFVIFNFMIYAIINAFTPGPGNFLALNTVTKGILIGTNGTSYCP